MADGTEGGDDRWADQVAFWTFVMTMVCALLFVGSVAVFILSTGGGR